MRPEAKSFRLRAASDAQQARQFTERLLRGDDDVTVPVVLDESLGLSEDDGRAPTASFALTGEVVAERASPVADYAKLLARLTGRAFRQAASVDDAVSHVGAHPTTVVVPSEQVTPELLARLPADRPVSIFTARDEAALTRLIWKTVTLTTPREPRSISLEYGAEDNRLTAVGGDTEMTLADLREWTRTPSDVFGIATHGRECGILLADGMICGRARNDSGAVATGHSTSCQHGLGCFRSGWRDPRLLSISDLRARVVFVDSCRVLRVSGGEFSERVALSLAALDGEAVAYFGSVWLREGSAPLVHLLPELVRSGHTLGEALVVMNDIIASSPGSFGDVALIGDAGLRLTDKSPLPTVDLADGRVTQIALTNQRPAALVRGADGFEVKPDGNTHTFQFSEGLIVARIDCRHESLVGVEPSRELDLLPSEVTAGALAALARCHLLSGPDLRATVAPLEAELLEMCSQPDASGADPAASLAHRGAHAGLLSRLEVLQDNLLEHWCAQAVSSFYTFSDDWSKAFRVRDDGRAECPVCRSPEMARLAYESPVLPLVQRLDVCPRCTEVWAGPYISQFSWHVTGDRLVHRGKTFTQTLTLRNELSVPLRCSVGAVVRNGLLHEVEFGRSTRATIRPGESAVIDFEGRFPFGGIASDIHYLKYLVVANGETTMLTRAVWLDDPTDEPQPS